MLFTNAIHSIFIHSAYDARRQAKLRAEDRSSLWHQFQTSAGLHPRFKSQRVVSIIIRSGYMHTGCLRNARFSTNMTNTKLTPVHIFNKPFFLFIGTFYTYSEYLVWLLEGTSISLLWPWMRNTEGHYREDLSMWPCLLNAAPVSIMRKITNKVAKKDQIKPALRN